MPEPEEKEGKKRPKEKDDATDALAHAADLVRKHENAIIVATCLVVLAIFGWRWWTGQRGGREASAWQTLGTEALTVEQLEKAVQQYEDTGAAPYLRMELGKKLHEAGKLAEAKKAYDEVMTVGEQHLAAQLTRGRLAELRREEDFLRQLPSKLAELAKNAPPPVIQEEVEPEFGPSRKYMQPSEAQPTPVPPGVEAKPLPPNPAKDPLGPPRDLQAPVEPPK